ncbi:MAG: hypothetical protein H0V00_01600 [Chloroflexia bacterium]|nr:hypothetical protein [Chloroflexia bacterium]
MRVPGRTLSIVAVAAAMTVGLVAAGLAQDATPTAMGDDAASAAYPNHFHLGTCDDLNPEPAVPLADLVFPDWVAGMSSGSGMDDSDVVMPDAADFGGAPVPVAVATTEVAVGLAEIISGGHALNVRDAADPSIYIACGNVGGVPDERGDLFIGLAEDEDSGFSGVAWLHDNGGSTTVVVFLSNPAAQTAIDMNLAAMMAAAATPDDAATPVGDAASTPEADADATPVT